MVDDWRMVIYGHQSQVIGDQNPYWDENELEEVIRGAIKACVEECMRVNSEDWIFTSLSGGLDSSVCLAIIRQLFPKAVVWTYTIGGNGQHPDIKFARMVAKLFDTIHVEIIPGGNEEKSWTNSYKNAFGINSPSSGDVAVFTLYNTMALRGAKAVIAHDGIDELLGGYWPHRKDTGANQKNTFRDFWRRLDSEHLIPLERSAGHFGINVILPYLQLPVVKYIAGIPVGERTSREESKIPLRNIARKYLPPEIIKRKKVGFCSGLERF